MFFKVPWFNLPLPSDPSIIGYIYKVVISNIPFHYEMYSQFITSIVRFYSCMLSAVSKHTNIQ